MIEIIIQTAVPIICAGILFLLYYGIKYLRARTENEKVKDALLVVENAVYGVVCELSGTADKYRDNNGKLSEQKAKVIKQKALTDINNIVSEQVKKTLLPKIFDFEKFISGQIEQTVKKVKK